jgi:hypothetical protein
MKGPAVFCWVQHCPAEILHAYLALNSCCDFAPVLFPATAAAAAVALCITWLVYTLSPARRAKASCCGNHTSCIAFRPDVGFDSAFAVLYGIGLITSALQGSISSAITSAVMMTFFIATAVLSSKMGRAVREQQASAVTGFAAPPVAVNMAAPPKAVEIV